MERYRSFLTILIVLSAIVLEGCTAMFTKADRPEIPVVVSTLSPPAPANNLGSIVAIDGIGCGLLGFLGNRENAVYIMKQKAVQHGANYVQILKTKEPYSDGQCRHNEFVLEGNAFKTVPLEEQEIGAITIRNSGFEEDVLARDGVAEAWHYNLKDWSGNKGGVFSVTATPSTFLAKKAPEGHNVAFLAFSGSNIEQALDFRLVPNRTYQLQVLVGRRTEAAFGEGDYQVELQAGGHIIAQERGKIPPAGEFKMVKVKYTAKRQDQKKGQPLKIVLRNINTRQINYDNVQLYNWEVGSNFTVPTIPQIKVVSVQEGQLNTSKPDLSGDWREIIFGRDMGVARIKQDGTKLKFWNFEKPPKFSKGKLGNSGVIHAKGWKLTAKLQDEGRKIVWSNGVIWIRK